MNKTVETSKGMFSLRGKSLVRRVFISFFILRVHFGVFSVRSLFLPLSAVVVKSNSLILI